MRTPRGKGRPDGAPHDVHPQELLAQCPRALAGRVGLDPTGVADVSASNGILATLAGLGRADADAFAVRSQERQNRTIGLVAMCTGGGMGAATILGRM
ncbi:hypothetical protein [Frankia sp. R82]|uniref:hypothetical protein n=1 Tax=Frankia sp. R82 TaxID=2950553 RepID=UPI0020434F54|nr:hypothetical protein [Frankia sp. R82]MCM3883377.1 hypothetical protein [Frankia sp. R82]